VFDDSDLGFPAATAFTGVFDDFYDPPPQAGISSVDTMHDQRPFFILSVSALHRFCDVFFSYMHVCCSLQQA